jgi:outer membrane murein-binding lipoprotein Lpp
VKPRLTAGSWRRLAAVLVGVLLLYGAFEYGRSVAGYSALSSLQQRQALAARVDELTREVEGLRSRVAASTVTRQADQETQAETQGMIGELQAELARQQQDLEFYRGLVEEKFGSGSLKVQELSIRDDGDARYTVAVTLVQTAVRDATASGSLTLAVSGSRGGSLTELKLPDVSVDGRDKVEFKVRYFTTVEVPLKLPPGFKPAAVQLEYRSSRSGPEPVRQSFPWAQALAGDAGAALTPGTAAE